MPDTWDFSPRPKGYNTPSGRASFDETAGELLKRAELVVGHLLPQGRREGHEWKCGDLHGSKGDSLSVNIKTGVWKDFATDDGGNDLISLWAAVKGLRMGDAKGECETWLGKAPAPRPEPRPATWQTAAPKTESPQQRNKLPTPDKEWAYVTANGEVWCFVHRFEARNGERKKIRPANVERTEYKKPDGLAPLLNLPDILDQADATVVLVEGEKCVDAIAELKIPGVVATTHIGGAQGLRHTDWSPLKGRKIVRWHDNDDAGRKWLQETLAVLEKAGAAQVRDVEIPPNWPDKEDAADRCTDERRGVIERAMASEPVFGAPPDITIAESTGAAYWNAPSKPRQWLIENLFPFGRGGLIAAQGDTGKGMLMIDMACKLVKQAVGGFNANPETAFGHAIARRGRVVILSAEDDRDELMERMRRLHPELTAEESGRLHILPYPNLKGRYPFYFNDVNGEIKPTDEFKRVMDEMARLENLVAVVLDPVSAFFHLDMTKNASAQVVGNVIDKMAADLGCTVIACHHLTKGDRNNPIETVSDARHGIQGGGQLLNALRFAYALWSPKALEQKRVLSKLGREFENNAVFKGAIVKSNAKADREIVTFARNKDTGLLEVIPWQSIAEEDLKVEDVPFDMVELVIHSIHHFASSGYPAKLGQIGYPLGGLKGTNTKGANGEWLPLMPEPWREKKWSARKHGGQRHEIIKTLIEAGRLALTGGYLHMPADQWATGEWDFKNDRKTGRPPPVPWPIHTEGV